MRKVIAQLLRDLPVPASGADAEAALMASLVATFAKSEEVNPISNVVMKVDVRPGENQLVASRLLDPDDEYGLVPVGLFNRLDLAPRNFRNCGEYRIVYAFKAPISPPKVGKFDDRFFLIFEMKMPNPQFVGAAGCLGLADFWRDLSDIEDDAQRIEALRKFYFDGIPGYTPGPIHPHHLGALGQLRGNLFIEDKWQLREWKLLSTDPGRFVMEPVKSNPLAELYVDAGKKADGLDPLRAEFHAAFVAHKGILEGLLEPELVFIPKAMMTDPRLNPHSPAFDRSHYEKVVVNRVGLPTPDGRFNEFQSDSQGTLDVPEENLGSDFRNDITFALQKLLTGFPLGASVTIDDVMARAGAATCGGCHQHANEKPIGTVNTVTFNWPTTQNNKGFVHITETGQLSKTLTDSMIPFRRDTLAKFICDPPLDETAGLGYLQERFEAALADYNQTLTDYRLTRLNVITTLQRDALTQGGPPATAAELTDAERKVTARFEESLRQKMEAVGDAERNLPGAFVENRRPH